MLHLSSAMFLYYTTAVQRPSQFDPSTTTMQRAPHTGRARIVIDWSRFIAADRRRRAARFNLRCKESGIHS